MKLPTNPLARVENIASGMLHQAILGIDFGTASTKIIQLSVENGVPVLNTYGEIDTGPFGEHEIRKVTHLDPPAQAAALMDLMHAVEAGCRQAGISIPLSSALISFVKMPRRDPEQMKLIIQGEAKQYVPVPIEQVTLDWMIVDRGDPAENAIDRAERNEPIKTIMQDVMLVAIEKSATLAYDTTVDTANITREFYEAELFSAIRACTQSEPKPTLFMDLGASSTKIYLTNSLRTPIAVHPLPFGGEEITDMIMQSTKWHFDKAEEAKRAIGLGSSDAYTESEQELVRNAIDATLSRIYTEASRRIKVASNEHDVDIAQVVLLGGGALLPSIIESAAAHFALPVLIADPFAHVRTPIILDDTLHAAGPKFAVAMGLALRGIRK